MLYEIRNLVKQRQREQGYKLLIRKLLIPRGARLAITGPSGCGKSTSLDILGLVLKPDSAETFIFSPVKDSQINLSELWQNRDQDRLASIRLEYMGYVLQTGDLLPFLDVLGNILLPARLKGVEVENHARELAADLGIENLLSAMPATLSVGERQRVAIARALVASPKLILADEPTAALDPRHADQVMAAFLRILDKTGATLLVVTHNAPWAINAGLCEAAFQLQETGEGITAILDYEPEAANH